MLNIAKAGGAKSEMIEDIQDCFENQYAVFE